VARGAVRQQRFELMAPFLDRRVLPSDPLSAQLLKRDLHRFEDLAGPLKGPATALRLIPGRDHQQRATIAADEHPGRETVIAVAELPPMCSWPHGHPELGRRAPTASSEQALPLRGRRRARTRHRAKISVDDLIWGLHEHSGVRGYRARRKERLRPHQDRPPPRFRPAEPGVICSRTCHRWDRPDPSRHTRYSRRTSTGPTRRPCTPNTARSVENTAGTRRPYRPIPRRSPL
jgi:hypothetical protein